MMNAVIASRIFPAGQAVGSTDPSTFLARAGFDCNSWSSLPRDQKLSQAATFAMQGKSIREGGTPIAVYADEYTTAEYNQLVHNGAVLSGAVDAYCLGRAVQSTQTMPKRKSMSFHVPSATRRILPAGQATSPSAGISPVWIGVAITAVVLAGAYAAARMTKQYYVIWRGKLTSESMRSDGYPSADLARRYANELVRSGTARSAYVIDNEGHRA